MPHDTTLISTIVAGLVLAFILGAVAHRLKLPPLVGYLVAGILVGPSTPGFIADQRLASQLAEIGVVLLMFGVGLHFSLGDLLKVRAIAIPGAIAQMGVATLLGCGLGVAVGWSVAGSLVFGLALSVASTVVLLKTLQDRRLIDTERGKIAIGWLIVEDLAMVLALVIIPVIATLTNSSATTNAQSAASVDDFIGFDTGVTGLILFTILKITGFVGLMLVVGRRIIPWLLHRIAHMGSRELFRLGVLAIALGVAFGAAELFGVSLALGAFFAGMILSESELSQRAAQESLPLRDAFAVLFFVSVGMLFDPAIIGRDPLLLLVTLFIIVVGKSVAAFLIVLAFGRTPSTALTISASLAQIGEFSFILAELSVDLKMLPPEARDLVLAGAILSIMLNPVVFYASDRIRPWLEARWGHSAAATPASSVPHVADIVNPVPSIAATMPTPPPDLVSGKGGGSIEETDDDPRPTSLAGHIVLVGFGRVGSLVAPALRAGNRPLLVIEDAVTRIAESRAMGIETIAGNAADTSVLALANLAGAKELIIAIPEIYESVQIATIARKANRELRIVARAHSDAEVDFLKRCGADTVIMGEREIAAAMVACLAAR
jgi:monovalent cation:H+ antiporter-2, CPA2 family